MTKLGMRLVTQMDLLLVRYRSNIGTAVTYGFETMFDWNLNRTLNKLYLVFFCIALTDSQYLKSDAPNIEGNVGVCTSF
jgi:Fe(3+) dicitrate transport protein